MNLLQVIVLAVVQGATEFIPISSSGHLVLVRHLLDWSDNGGVFFDTVLHAGSLLAILIYFYKDWLPPVRAVFNRRPDDAPHRRMLFFLFIATLPAVLFGPIIEHYMNDFRTCAMVGLSMIMTALWYVLCERRGQRSHRDMLWQTALFIGCIQVFALLPGASRSGLTIGAGVLCGLRRTEAAKFSFLMAIPTLFGAAVLESGHIQTAMVGMPMWQPVLGFIICFIVSLAAIHFCLQLFRKYSLLAFAFYMGIFGCALALFPHL
ncbi:MAG: undecaprenyl-diphosphate phosphatase [Spartobacteria bacterium]|nr:undecaprenyl-diphosphate phosphatase [Spartobacteria bacterium]